MALEGGGMVTRSRTNYVVLRGTLINATEILERDARRLLEIQLHVAPPGPWREAVRHKPLVLSVFAWSDVVPRSLCAMPAGNMLTVIGHLVPTPDHGLEVFVDALARDVEGALDGSGPATAAVKADGPV